MPLHEHPEWILQAVLTRAERMLAQNAEFLCKASRSLHETRYFHVTQQRPDSWQRFTEVFRRPPLERELAALEALADHPITLTGPQMVELLGLGRLVTDEDQSELKGLPEIFHLQFVLPVLAEYLHLRQQRRLVPDEFLRGLSEAGAPGPPDFAPYYRRGLHLQVQPRNIMPHFWGMWLRACLTKLTSDFSEGRGLWAPLSQRPRTFGALERGGEPGDDGETAGGGPTNENEDRLPPPPQLRPVPLEEREGLTSRDMQTRAEYIAWSQEVTGLRVALTTGPADQSPPLRLEILTPIRYEGSDEESSLATDPEWASVDRWELTDVEDEWYTVSDGSSVLSWWDSEMEGEARAILGALNADETP